MELTPVSSFCALGSSSANASGGSMAAAEIDELFSTSHFAPVPARITPRSSCRSHDSLPSRTHPSWSPRADLLSRPSILRK